MRFASLGSGSEGNALVIEQGSTRVLLDCGFSVSESCARLARLGIAPEQLSGILVTHEHSDHISGVARLARKYALPVYLTHGTRRARQSAFDQLANMVEIDSHSVFAIEDLQICPFTVPHDANQPVQYVFDNGDKRLGVLTDVGRSTPHIEAMLSGCAALVLECNHDVEMLRNGVYPPHLKQRVGGDFGHLSNAAAAGLLSNLDVSGLQHLVAAHISQKNNTVALATTALSNALDCERDWIGVATQVQGLDWRDIV